MEADTLPSLVVPQRASKAPMSSAAAKRWRKDDGAEAIAEKRRNSNSFKTLSSGNLVKNSPFARRLGQIGSSSSSAATTAPESTPPASVRAPSPVERRVSNGSSRKRDGTPRKVSAEDGPIKENHSPHEQTNLQRKPSIEQFKPVAPFRPTRGHAASSSVGSASLMAKELGHPLPPAARPISMPPLSSPAANAWRTESDSPLGLGLGPHSHPLFERRAANASTVPSMTPPSASPVSAMSPSRRTADDVDQSPLRVLRHKASTKTVTWATTEEVLEYEPDEGRRSSNVSDASIQSSQTDDSEEAERSITFDEGDSGFTEGGSIEVHDWPANRNHAFVRAPGSSDSSTHERVLADTTGPSVEDMMSEIEDIMSGDMLSPVPPPASNSTWGYAAAEAYRESPVSIFAKRAIQNSKTSPASQNDEIMSSSEYSDDGHARNDGTDIFKQALPSEPARSTRAQPLPAPLVGLGPAFSPKLANGQSMFGLPNLPANSPLTKLLDDGTASSVVTLDLEDPTTPQASISNASRAALLSTFTAAGPVALSRQASLIGSEVSVSSSTGSLRNSRLLLQRAKLEEVLRQDALLTPQLSGPSSPDLRRFPDISRDRASPLRTSLTETLRSATQQVRTHLETVSRSPSSQTITAPTEAPREILARPALRPRSATVSDQILSNLSIDSSDNVVGKKLTPDMVESLQSPLERLSAHSQSQLDGQNSPTDDTTSASSAAHPQIVEPASASSSSVASGSTVGRRRSLSTSAASVAETTSRSFIARKPVPRDEPAAHLDVPIKIDQRDLELDLDKTFDHIIENGDRTYRLREARQVVYASDGVVPTLRAAGDTTAVGWHKKRRPSDLRMSAAGVNDQPDASDKFAGRVFVTLIEAQFEHLQPASRVTKGECFISCGGTSIRAGSFAVAASISIRKEFELVARENLSFVVEVRVPVDPNVNVHLMPPTPNPPSSPTKRMFKTVFSSPKKRTASPKQPPVPERLLQNLTPSGILASSDVVWKDIMPSTPCTVVRIERPFEGDRNAPQPVSGTLVFEVYHIPVIVGLSKNGYPLSVAEAKAGFALAEQQSILHHEGVLTQLGGDCSTWRRRYFKLVGNRLVPYSEVTRKAHVEIELSLAESVEDPDEKKAGGDSAAAKGSVLDEDSDEALWSVENMFKVNFKDGSHINFFADTAAAKTAWLEQLKRMIDTDKGSIKSEPEWAKLLLKQLQAQRTSK